MLIVVICYCSRFQADFCSKYIAIFGSLFSFESCEMVLNANSLKNWCQITNDGAEVSSHVNWHCCWLVVGWCYYRKSWGNYQVSPTSLRSKDSSNRRQWSWTRCTDKISWAFRHSWTDKQSWAADQRSFGRGITCSDNKLLGPDRSSNRWGSRFNGSLVQPLWTGWTVGSKVLDRWTEPAMNTMNRYYILVINSKYYIVDHGKISS